MTIFTRRDGTHTWHQIRLPLIGELNVLPLVVFTANIIVATVAWVVVGALLK
jgi:hypothetical protein